LIFTGISATPKQAKVEIQKDGNVDIVPCASRQVSVGGNPFETETDFSTPTLLLIPLQQVFPAAY